MAETGKELAWDLLAEMEPKVVQSRAGVTYSPAESTYCVKSLGQDIYIDLQERKIFAKTSLGNFMLEALGYLSQLSVLWYLVEAKDIQMTGELIIPSELPGGEIFLKGTHVLPLDKITRRFDHKSAEFLQIANELGGLSAHYGDMAVRLFPFPRIPVVIAVWHGDDEVPATCSVLLDSSCALHLPTDIAWSTVLLAIEVMLFASN